MSNTKILYDDGTHKCIMFSFDEEEHDDRFLSVNQYLIINDDKAILIDPGSQSAFPDMYDAVLEYTSLDNIKLIFFSHQDPDVAGSITSWSNCTNAKIIISKLWIRFMSHYGLMDSSRMIALEDEGASIHFGDNFFQFIPAHFLHSPGNFSLYDSKSKILFSGDIGAAIVQIQHLYKEVTNFEEHLPFLEGFHKRYMAGNIFTQKWVSKARALSPQIIAPQHGAIFAEENVEKFLTWFEHLQCGGDLIELIYEQKA